MRQTITRVRVRVKAPRDGGVMLMPSGSARSCAPEPLTSPRKHQGFFQRHCVVLRVRLWDAEARTWKAGGFQPRPTGSARRPDR